MQDLARKPTAAVDTHMQKKNMASCDWGFKWVKGPVNIFADLGYMYYSGIIKTVYMYMYMRKYHF